VDIRKGEFKANFGKIVTGDHGFMVNIDLDNPPPKPGNSLRVLITGGSAAAGHGVVDCTCHL